MAGLLISKTRSGEVVNLGEVSVLNMNLAQSSRITDLPVESGSTISDHIQPQPDRISVRGMIGNLFVFRASSVASGASLPTAWQTLRTLRESGELLTFVTDLQVYNNMAIERISAPRNVRTGKSLFFDLNLKEIRLSKVQERAITPNVDPDSDPDNPATDLPTDDTNRGRIGVTPTEEDLPPPTGENGTGPGAGGFGSHDRVRLDGGTDDEVNQGRG